jgi:hypothetical protein
LSHASKPNPRGTPGQNPQPSSGFRAEDPSDPVNPLVPTYRYRLAPDGLLTYNQLRAVGLRPGGHDPVAQLQWRSKKAKGGVREAYLYDVALALPVRPMTPAKRRAIDAALRAQRICPACGEDRGYRIPSTLGTCTPCAGDEP